MHFKLKKIMRKFIVLIGLAFFSFPLLAQHKGAVVSGFIKENSSKLPVEYVNITIEKADGSIFITGTITNNKGFFSLSDIKPGDYVLKASFIGYSDSKTLFHVGQINRFLDLGTILITESSLSIDEVSITAARREVSAQMDKKTFSIDEATTQRGGSVLQALQNIPSVTVDQNGKLFLRGSDKVTILIDGKQTAITGMGSQAGLDNLPASAIESIEIINNPSAKYDASGMAGIINIKFKKQQQVGWNGKAGLAIGVGGLSVKKENLAGIRDQYIFTPKINPSISTNYKKDKLNFFVMADLLYHKQMMKNEFTQRTYNDGEIVTQQFLENRTQPIYNVKGGVDYSPNSRNTFTFSSLFNYREYTDLGDIPYFNAITGNRNRLWQYYENEVNQTLFATVTHKHSFIQPGHTLVSSFNYSFRRKDELFYFSNETPTITGTDTTGLIADENIFDLTVDYAKPLRSGRIEIGTKQRARIFPNDIFFNPGLNSILDMGLAGTAEYQEYLSAFYTNFIYEKKSIELEAGLRVEYAKINYLVDPNHTVYQSDGFNYIDPFPTLRATWIVNSKSRLTLFYNRRVDRPEEKDLRVFPTYANPEILYFGNPTLNPQFTHSVELGYRRTWASGFIYSAAYSRVTSNILTRIITEVPGTNRLASISQNADKGTNSGIELVFSQQIGTKVKLNANANIYQNVIGAFTITSAYPQAISFSNGEQKIWAGNAKLNLAIKLPKKFDLQIAGVYLAPDIVPQGKILARYSVDAGLTREIQKGKGELFINATDILNTLVVRQQLQGSNFSIESDDYYETQVIRVGYQYRF